MNPNVVQQQIQDQNLRKALAQTPAAYRDALAQSVADNQVVFKRDAYYSKGRITATVTTSSSPIIATYTVSKGYQAVLFNYGVTDPLGGAGFATSLTPDYNNATLSETNLIHGSETNGAELMLITGIGFILTPDADPLALKAVMPSCYMSGGVNGNTNDFKWGPPIFWPGGSGIFGAGLSYTQQPGLFDSNATQVGTAVSGIPGAEDYSRDIDPVLWGPKGQADSTFTVVCSVTRTVTWTATDRTAIVASAGTPTTVTVFAHPTAGQPGSYIDFWVRLFGAQFAPRGKNR